MSRKTTAKSILRELPYVGFGTEKVKLIRMLCTALIEDRIEIKDVPDIEHVEYTGEQLGYEK